MARLSINSPSTGKIGQGGATALIAIASFLLSVMVAVGMAMEGIKIGIVAIAAVFAVPVVYICITNIKAGYAFVFGYSFFLLGVKRFVGEIPMGLIMELLILILTVGMFLQQAVKKANWNFIANWITFFVILWIIYNILQALNPIMASRMAWLYTVRGSAGQMIFYFIGLYAIDNIKYLKLLTKIWIFIAFAAGLYAMKQEYFGLTDWEHDWVFNDPERYGLLFVMNHVRKFSFFSDPMIFGVCMAYTSVLCLILAMAPFKVWQRIALVVGAVVMFLGMFYSGTRAAYAGLPAGVAFFSVITLQRKVILAGIILFMIGFVLANIPTSDVNLVRFQTAFKPSEDESFNVRKRNQESVKPFIRRYWMGGGLGSTGVWGKQFSPDSPLANFPPDSGFVRVVVEMGLFGLFFFCALIVVIFLVGVNNYHNLKDPQLRYMMVGYLAVLFILVLTNYPQEAMGQIPNALVFYTIIAVIVKIPLIDKQLLQENGDQSIDSVQGSPLPNSNSEPQTTQPNGSTL